LVEDGTYDIYYYSTILASPIQLYAGTLYWLSIQNDTTGDNGGEWAWTTANSEEGNALIRTGGGAWGGTGDEMAFYLTADGEDVPDGGATLALLGVAFAALGMLRRKLS
jgi:hypothetical protein